METLCGGCCCTSSSVWGWSWREVEIVNEGNQGCSSFFQMVTTDSENLYLILSDGTQITIPIISTSRSFAGKVVSIMGDSISTFEGWIPIEDGHNLNHRKRYPQYNLFDDVRLTWWHRLTTNLGAKLGVNDSWAGSMIHNSQTVNSGDKGPDACMSSITRITNLGSNGTPDLIFLYGGTNDAARDVTLGTFEYPGEMARYLFRNWNNKSRQRSYRKAPQARDIRCRRRAYSGPS